MKMIKDLRTWFIRGSVLRDIASCLSLANLPRIVVALSAFGRSICRHHFTTKFQELQISLSHSSDAKISGNSLGKAPADDRSPL